MLPEEELGNRKIIQIFNELYSIYGPQHWWPGDSQIEIIVGAVLTQNTAWHNVSKAIDNLRSNGLLNLEALMNADEDIVKTLIKPAGFFNIKYERLISVLSYLLSDQGMERVSHRPLDDVREELLKIRGIGPETADSILLYAFGQPIFVVDAYTRRLFSRIGYSWIQKASYDEVQRFFMANLPIDTKLYNEFHALIVKHCKTLCKKIPLCSECKVTCPKLLNETNAF